MGQALIISNHSDLLNIFELNLRAYVGLNCVSIFSKDEAPVISYLNLNLEIDVAILYLENIENMMDQNKKIVDIILQSNPHFPIVVLGQDEGSMSDVLCIKNPFNIKKIVSSIAHLLNITARQMYEKETLPYFQIPIDSLKIFERSPMNILQRTKSEEFSFQYKIVILEGERVAPAILKLNAENTKKVFIDSVHRLKFINLSNQLVVNALEKKENLSSEEAINYIQVAAEVVAEQVLVNPKMTAEVARISKRCVDEMGKVVLENPKMKKLVAALLENKTDYLYFHAILATFYAEKIITNMSWGSEEQVRKVTFAFFFHDIFLVPIYKKYPNASQEEDLYFDEATTEEDKKIILDHAKLAGELIQTFPSAPMGVDMIITQHHGMVGGSGFAQNYRDDISPLSKVMIIAEEASYETFKLYKENKLDVLNYETICDFLEQKFPNHTYKKLIATLRKLKDE
jgi:HD-GYP domain-containing protein (c-di-GMP phosphodiesterase class II)